MLVCRSRGSHTQRKDDCTVQGRWGVGTNRNWSASMSESRPDTSLPPPCLIKMMPIAEMLVSWRLQFVLLQASDCICAHKRSLKYFTCHLHLVGWERENCKYSTITFGAIFKEVYCPTGFKLYLTVHWHFQNSFVISGLTWMCNGWYINTLLVSKKRRKGSLFSPTRTHTPTQPRPWHFKK